MRIGLKSPSWPIVGALLAALAVTSPVRAQETSAAVATELFNAGRDLMNGGRFAEACPKLAQSARLEAKVGTLARLAECEERLGQTLSARTHWQQAANVARAENDGRLAHAEAELKRVDKLVPKVNVSLAGPTPAGLSLAIDGVEVGAASLGLPLPVDAGRHVIVVSAKGKKPFTATLEIIAGGAVTSVTVPSLEDAPTTFVSLVPATPAPAVPPRRDATDRAPPRRDLTDRPSPSRNATDRAPPFWTTGREVGLAVGGAGVASLAVGAVFGVLTKVEYDKSNQDGCTAGTTTCRGTGTGERNTAFTDGTLGTAFLIAGGIAAATGVTLWLVSPGEREGDGLRAAVWIVPGVMGMGGAF